MCLHFFAPGREVHIDYAAESVSLIRGGNEFVLDVLVTNHSADEIDRLHIVYPHGIPYAGKPRDAHSLSYFEDITSTWLEKKSPYNRFYDTDQIPFAIEEAAGGALRITLSITDPKNITKKLPYVGIYADDCELVPFEVSEGQQLTFDQWQVLTDLDFSVQTIKFTKPMLQGEARWLRFRGYSGIGSANRVTKLEYIMRKMTGYLVHTFEIVGPLDVHHRIASALSAAEVSRIRTEDLGHAMLELSILRDRLLHRGLSAPNTITTVKDWRINIFKRRYRKLEEISTSGDLRPCGDGYNPMKSTDGLDEWCFQYKAGERNIPSQRNGGRFTIRLRAQDLPLFVVVMPLLAFGISMVALLTRPDILSFIKGLVLKLRSLVGY